MATSPFYNQTFFDPTPVAGVTVAAANGTLAIYEQGSNTLASIWTDAALSVPKANPMTLNGAGQCPQYFVAAGQALDYKALTSDARVIVTALNVTASSGSGGGVDDHKVATDVGDTAPDYLEAKLLTSTSVRFSFVSPGGVHLMTAQVDEGWLASWIAEQGYGSSDHKVLADGSPGDVPGYLVVKFVDAAGNPLLVNGAHQLVLPFARLDGAAFTASVSIADELSVGGDASFTGQLYAGGHTELVNALIDQLQIFGATAGQWLMVNGSGQVVGVAAPSSDHKVLYDVSDAIPGFLGVKVVQGAGIYINWTNDLVNGKVMHLNVQAGYFQRTIQKTIITTPIALGTAPATDITGDVYAGGFQGNGSGHVQPLAANTLVVGSSFRYNISCGQVSSSTGTEIEMRLNGAQVPGTVANFASTAVKFQQEIKMLITAIGPSGSMITEQSAYGIDASGNTVSASVTQTVDSIDTTQESFFSYWANGNAIGSTIGKISTTLEAI